MRRDRAQRLRDRLQTRRCISRRAPCGSPRRVTSWLKRVRRSFVDDPLRATAGRDRRRSAAPRARRAPSSSSLRLVTMPVMPSVSSLRRARQPAFEPRETAWLRVAVMRTHASTASASRLRRCARGAMLPSRPCRRRQAAPARKCSLRPEAAAFSTSTCAMRPMRAGERRGAVAAASPASRSRARALADDMRRAPAACAPPACRAAR